MLRIHFGPEDLIRTRIAAAPDPLWEIASSLHRFQTQSGRRAYAGWYREARAALSDNRLGAAVLGLLTLFPRAAYFPDFLTPPEAGAGLEHGLAAILSTPPARVRHEIGRLVQVTDAPSAVFALVDKDARRELVRVLRAYNNAVIAPYRDRMQACVDAERGRLARAFLDGGTDSMLRSLPPITRWRPPVLEVDYCETRDLHLDGRGLLFIPSYFCWRTPVSLADPGLPPVLVYPVSRPDPRASADRSDAPLTALLGRTRAAVLNVVANGATNSELARAVSVSPATATHHTTVLRDAGLIESQRHANTVLHTLTPAGAALLRPHRRGPSPVA
ncbi:ArsR/SmtB family transcription factor [Streptomyces sp. DSM 40750]|uniref:ArsR/SmtB family transcription factor n=1 Tax=Streptomyces sp. DSM 40750 TaxID=2801030 RepID=UPI00214BFD82|nr:winged helix-turn-helix domain-containing protein [Streptomyces sp. DSM 40750]UUU26339.1 winged helix-turn-helix domain-containing protein [Streptomyces sp. DSM 40750]